MTAPAHPKSGRVGWNALCISAEDNVAVALRDLQGEADVLTGGKVVRQRLLAPIPLGHKFALANLPAGAEIRKYGEVIGILTVAVVAGEHIHVQNLASRRASSRTGE